MKAHSACFYFSFYPPDCLFCSRIMWSFSCFLECALLWQLNDFSFRVMAIGTCELSVAAALLMSHFWTLSGTQENCYHGWLLEMKLFDSGVARKMQWLKCSMSMDTRPIKLYPVSIWWGFPTKAQGGKKLVIKTTFWEKTTSYSGNFMDHIMSLS